MDITKIEKDGFYLSSKSIDVAINSLSEKADVALMSKKTENLSGSKPILFDSPGEYEVKTCMIDAIPLGKGNCGFSVLADKIRVAYISDVTTTLTDQQLEAFASVDVLILPVIGEKSEVTTKIINQVEPSIVIPHNYTDEQLKVLSAEFGSEQETLAKFKITKKELIENDQQRLIVLE